MKLTFEATGPATDLASTAQPMVRSGNMFVPKFPAQLADVGIDPDVVAGLALKHGYAVPKFSTEWMLKRLCLPLPAVTELLEGLRDDHLIEVVGHSGPFGYNYAATGRGREHAKRLMEISGYVGPTPVSLESYIRVLNFQFDHLPPVTPEDVNESVAHLVLAPHIQDVGGIAIMSRRSLFLHGPAGNGKTTLGHSLHNAVHGNIWIPHAIAIGNEVIRVFDSECHVQASVNVPEEASMRADARWVHIERPFIVVGGELTMEALDLIYDRSHGYYEAPLHFKANGGTFLLDDFGCQRVPHEELLNRWIHPLERGVDFLTLKTGQQLEVPFRQMLIVSTNLDPDDMMSPAFLRRMGYRIHIPNPSPDEYSEIFHRYAENCGTIVPDGLVDSLVSRYRHENRPMRSCEPRDLIERTRDFCKYRGVDLELSIENLSAAWEAYFGNTGTAPPPTANGRHH